MITVSHAVEQELVTRLGWPAERITVIPNGVALDPLLARARRAGRHARELRAGQGARGLPRGGGARSPPARPATRFALYGTARTRPRCTSRARALGLDGAVSFPGHVPARSALAEPPCSCCPSYMENSPLALLEAMTAGVPVVATRVGGVPELAPARAPALLVAPGDPAALAAAIGRLLDDPALAREQADAARAHVEATAARPRWSRGRSRSTRACWRGEGPPRHARHRRRRRRARRDRAGAGAARGAVTRWCCGGRPARSSPSSPARRVTRVVVPARGRSPAGVVEGVASLAATIRRTRPQVVHAHNPRVAGLAALGVRLARGPRRPPRAGDVPRRAPRRVPRGGRAAARRRRGDAASRRTSPPGCGTPGCRPTACTCVANSVVVPAAREPARDAALDAELGLGGAPVVAIRRPPRRAEEPRALPRRRGGGRRGPAGRALPRRRRRAAACGADRAGALARARGPADAHRRAPRRAGARRARRPRRVLLRLGGAVPGGARGAGGGHAGAQHAGGGDAGPASRAAPSP